MKREGGGRGLHKRAVLQHPGHGRAFKGLGVAKRYRSSGVIGDTFVQGPPAIASLVEQILGVPPTERRKEETKKYLSELTKG